MGVQPGWSAEGAALMSVFFTPEFKGSCCLSPSAFPFPQPLGGPGFLFTASAAGPARFLGLPPPPQLLPELLSPDPHPSSVEPASSSSSLLPPPCKTLRESLLGAQLCWVQR